MVKSYFLDFFIAVLEKIYFFISPTRIISGVPWSPTSLERLPRSYNYCQFDLYNYLISFLDCFSLCPLDCNGILPSVILYLYVPMSCHWVCALSMFYDLVRVSSLLGCFKYYPPVILSASTKVSCSAVSTLPFVNLGCFDLSYFIRIPPYTSRTLQIKYSL